MQLVHLQILCECTYLGHQARRHTGTVKIDLDKFCHLKKPCNSHNLRFIKTLIFMWWNKNKKWLDCFFFQARTLTIKWHLPEKLIFQNLLKNRNLLPAEKLYWLLISNLKESYYHVSADSFIKNNIAYDQLKGGNFFYV